MITPEQLAKPNTEHAHQSALFCYFALPAVRENYPDARWLFAIKNQGHGDRVRGARSAAEGVRAGVPDILLPVRRWPYSGLWIELKRPSSVGKARGYASAEQKEWMEHLRAQGFRAEICVGWIEAKNKIEEYLRS